MMHAEAYILTTPNGPLEHQSISIAAPSPGEAVLEVDACGLCHTDLGFADGSVTPKHALPLVLGHEIVGKVIATGALHTSLLGRQVLVPSVLPCGTCLFCQAGRGNACPTQKMPGNDINGGFATHILVPARSLIPIDDAPSHIDKRTLAVVADAVSTAYQAIQRSGLQRGDLALVVGSGGVGGYTIQIAKAMGARVIAFDISESKLKLIANYGAEHTVDTTGRAPKEIRKEIQALARQWAISSYAHRIFECSGTPAGQTLAYTLLGTAATMVQVGYTPKTVELRLSNIMAFDATLHGSWGCPPEAYPEVLKLIYTRELVLEPFVQHVPMSQVNEMLSAMTHHRLTKRVIFDPRS